MSTDSKIQLLSVEEAFGLESNLTAPGYKASNNPAIPSADPDYHFPANLLKRVLAWWAFRAAVGGNDGLALSGPTGCGKSTMVEQFSARLGVPVWSVICSPYTEPEDVFGSVGLAGGHTVFEKGPAIRAAEAGGILLLEEGDRLDPTVMGMIAPLMEGKPCRAPGDGRLVHPKGLFAVAMTTNTRGGLDETGLYVGARQQNLATMSRFQSIEVGYLSEVAEMELLEKKVITHLDPAEQDGARQLLNAYLMVARQTRESHLDPSAGLDTVISTRVLLRWASLGIAFRKVGVDDPDRSALDQALLNSCSADTQDAVHDFMTGVLG